MTKETQHELRMLAGILSYCYDCLLDIIRKEVEVEKKSDDNHERKADRGLKERIQDAKHKSLSADRKPPAKEHGDKGGKST